MKGKFEFIRIFENNAETHFGFQTHNRIEFVVDRSKLKQFAAYMFGNVYNVGTSRYHDDVMVYRPQDITDFLTFLANLQVKEGKINIYKMNVGQQQILPNKKSTYYYHTPVSVKYLIDVATESFVSEDLSEEQQKAIKVKFVGRCKEILAQLGVEYNEAQENEI